MRNLFLKLNPYRMLISTTKITNLTSTNVIRHVSDSKNDPNVPLFDLPNPFEKEKPECILCKLNITPNYKNVRLLSQFQSPYTGQVYGRHITGLCTHKQEELEAEIKKAQSAGLMGSYNKDPIFTHDPKLFDPENPIRSHRF